MNNQNHRNSITEVFGIELVSGGVCLLTTGLPSYFRAKS